MENNEILSTKNLKVYFLQKRKVIKALDGIDVFLKKGVVTSLAGESGCGKTTLAKTILGFYKPKEGSIYFNGKNIALKENQKVIRKNIQIVFQNPFASLDPRCTMFYSLYEALRVFKKIKNTEIREFIKKQKVFIAKNEMVVA